MGIARLSAKCNQQPAFIYAALIFVSSFRNEIDFFFCLCAFPACNRHPIQRSIEHLSTYIPGNGQESPRRPYTVTHRHTHTHTYAQLYKGLYRKCSQETAIGSGIPYRLPSLHSSPPRSPHFSFLSRGAAGHVVLESRAHPCPRSAHRRRREALQ